MSAAAVSLITANLFLGFSGPQVFSLQQLLNRDLDTRIASAGPGSPGYETTYFGSLTRAAIIRFQEKYASEVLSPAGLMRGSGYVGSYTRHKLNALSAKNTLPVSANPVVAPPVVISPAPVASTSNPNLKNLGEFLSLVDSEATRRGLSAANITAIKDQFIKTAATTTDLRAAFSKIAIRTFDQAMRDDSILSKVLTMVGGAFKKVFVSERALAAIGVPFGGALLYAAPCLCSGTWIIGVQPLPPTYASLLTYEPGSQAYLSYNIPATSELLGFYAPGAGVCLVPGTPCVYVPNYGLITPTVGSSL